MSAPRPTRAEKPDQVELAERRAAKQEATIAAANERVASDRDLRWPEYEKWDLSDARVVLGVEARNLPAARKEDIIARHFKTSAARYYQRLNALIDTPEALAIDPLLVHRLRKMRDARSAARASRAFRLSS